MEAIRRSLFLLLFALSLALRAFAQTAPALSISGLVTSPRGFIFAEMQKMPWITVDATFAAPAEI